MTTHCNHNFMFFHFLLFIVAATTVSAISLSQQVSIRGSLTTAIIYNQAEVDNLDYVAVSVANNKIYIIGVTGGVAYNVICRETITSQIIVARKGCDNRDESTSFLRTNCGHKTIDGLNQNWFATRTSDQCLRAPNSATCLGPMYLVSTGKPYDPFVDNDFDLIQGVYLVSGTGPSCAIPTITRVDIELPSLEITSTCSYLPAGVYHVDTQESHRRHMAFSLLTTMVRIYPSGPSSPTMRMEVEFVSQLVYTHNPFYFGTQFVVNDCGFKVRFILAPRPFAIKPLIIPNSANYYIDSFSIYNRGLVCNWNVGKKSFRNNRPLFGGVIEGMPMGGKAIFRTEHGIPIQVDADPRFSDFVHDCSRFYPASETFHGFGLNGFDGPLYNRYEPAQYTCYAPFPFPELIIQLGTQNERAKQCRMLGGRVATLTNDVCSMDSWRTYCRRGWIFFDERCWYKFDSEKEATLRVPRDEGDTVCARLHADSIATYPLTIAVKAWLQRFYVYWKYPETITRATLAGARCLCFTVQNTFSCDCDEPYFPLCSYHIKNDLPFYWDIDIHPETMELFRLGQQGVPMGSQPIQCECELGWTGQRCDNPTCILSVQIAQTLNESLANPVIRFFKLCYTKQRGFCLEDSVYSCGCTHGYGPPGDLQNYINVNYPCMFPSLVGISPIERTIGMDKNLSLSVYGVCGFYTNGVGVLEGFNDAYCICNTRWSLDQSREIAFYGAACACHAPHHQEGGSIIETICNRHGTCCPHGERDDGTSGFCPDDFNGCYCDSGWGGESCTASTPHRLILERPFELSDIDGAIVYARLDTRQPIGYVYVSQPSTIVGVRDSLDGAIIANCTIVTHELWEHKNSSRETKWDCHGAIGWYITSNVSSPETLTFVATDSTLPICGVHVNLAAARFFDIPFFRSMNVEEELQPFKFSQYGAINSECHCLPGFAGTTCRVGISSWRLSEESAEFTERQCGDSTEPKRGSPSENGCVCGFLGNAIKFSGDACEIPIVDGEVCAGHGTPHYATFPNGTCSYDRDDLVADSLSIPYQSPPIPPSRFLIERGSIVYIQGQPYALDQGDVIGIEGIYTSDVQFCPEELNSERPTVTLVLHSSPIALNQTVHIYYENCSCTQIQTELPVPEIWCSTSGMVDLCIVSVMYDIHPTQTILPNGRYPDVEFVCIHANVISSHIMATLDCSNPVDRIIADGLREEGITNACIDEPISAFHQTLGVGYGLFHNLTLNLDFRNDVWTEEHYRFIASIINGHRCDEFSTMDWIRYANSWSNMWHSSTTTLISELSITSATNLSGIIVHDTNGEICETIIYPITENIPITVNCTHCPIGCSSGGVTYLNKSIATNIQSIATAYRNVSFTPTMLEEFRAQILVDHDLPYNTPLNETWCGVDVRALNVSSSDDQTYLSRFYNVHLAARTCSSDRQCRHFYRGATCVFDTSQRRLWRNGDDTIADLPFGDEGGCDCSTSTSGFFSQMTFCSSCVYGYGPDTEHEIRSMYDYNTQITEGEWIEGGLESVTRCSLPVDPISTRQSIICGGKGYVRGHNRTSIFTASLVQEKYIRLCESIESGGLIYHLLDADGVLYGLSSYINGTKILNEVYGELYNDETGQVVSDWTCHRRESINTHEAIYYNSFEEHEGLYLYLFTQ